MAPSPCTGWRWPPPSLATDSAWTERGRPVAAAQLTARLAGAGLPLPDGHVGAAPASLAGCARSCTAPRPRALLDAGLLQDLGTHGLPWHPTSSVRTVHRSDAPAMLKLSLGLRITNSRRENLRKELHRGSEVHRLLRSGLSRQWRAAHPGFDIVRDPAWLAVDGPDGEPVPGLDVVIRHNPFNPAADVSCVAGLVSPRPRPTGTGDGHGTATDRPRSRLAEVVTRLAAPDRPSPGSRSRRVVPALPRTRWSAPCSGWTAEAGIALEAHQQNTLVLLDADGWPAGGRFRDNQGYYFRASRRDAARPAAARHRRASDTFVADEVADERFAYYLGDQQRPRPDRRVRRPAPRGRTGAARRVPPLPGRRGLRTGPAAHALPDLLLDSPVLRCKANLLTRLHGLDELVGPVDTQSVYVTIANPLVTPGSSPASIPTTVRPPPSPPPTPIAPTPPCDPARCPPTGRSPATRAIAVGLGSGTRWNCACPGDDSPHSSSAGQAVAGRACPGAG